MVIVSRRAVLGTFLVASTLLMSCANIANAHSRLLSPRPRWGEYCSSGFNGSLDECPPCGPNGKAGADPARLTYERGQTVPLAWPRNNHPGGFIAVAVVPFDSPQVSHEEFTDNIVQYGCHESGCRSGDARQPLGGDPQGTPEDGNVCSSSWTVPAWLPDGRYTMQWRWFGGGSWFGDINRGVGDWVNCVDFTVAGGAAIAPKPSCPVFVPGDAHVPPASNQCLYFGAPEPRKCIPDACHGEYKRGVPLALEQCWASSALQVPPAPSSSA